MDIESLYEVFLKNGEISTDSRTVKEGDIFFALKGDSFNGNEYARDALDKGATCCVIDEKCYCNHNDTRYILVEDSLQTLQDLAEYHRTKFDFPVIGITGTNGKTTTKELVAGVLLLKYKVSATQGNLNNHIGVPLSLLAVDVDNTDLCVIEMGANHVGEIAFLCEISKPDFGIITSIGKAHIEGFGSFENIIKTKLELYDYIAKTNGKLFVDAGNEILVNNLPSVESVFYGATDLEIETQDTLFCTGKLDETTMNLSFDWKTRTNEAVFHVDGKMYGKYNFINMLAATCVGSYFDIAGDKISHYLNNFLPKNNRSQIIKIGSNTIISDAYNANPSSMEVALETFEKLNAYGKIIVIGDMFELGKESEKEHRKIVEKIRNMTIERVILVGQNYQQLNSEFESYKTIDEVMLNFKINELENKNILVKGSRGMKLEKLFG